MRNNWEASEARTLATIRPSHRAPAVDFAEKPLELAAKRLVWADDVSESFVDLVDSSLVSSEPCTRRLTLIPRNRS